MTLATGGKNQALIGFAINKNVATSAGAGIIGNNNNNAYSLNSQTCKMLLSKCAMTKAPGSGRRAERLFFRMLHKINETHWHPDAECVNFVIKAHLQEDTSLSHVYRADRFVRQCVKQFGLQKPSQPNTDNNGANPRPSRIFERLLEAYGTVSENDQVKAVQLADELFRFFLFQYRDGRVATEVPDERHLQLLVRLWKRNKSLRPETIAEYHQLINDLHKRGISKS